MEKFVQSDMQNYFKSPTGAGGLLNASGYRAVANDHGGIDYFSGNEPITNTMYRFATGANTDAMEKQAAVDFKAQQANPNQPSDFQIYNNTGNGSSSAQTANYQTLYGLNGELIGNYDLNNHDDRTKYYNDKSNYLGTVRDNYISELQKTSKKNLSDAQLATDKTLAAIDQELADLQTESKNYVVDYNKRVNAFGDAKDLGDVNRLSYFSGLGANAFQSSAASSQDYANNQYYKGLGDLANEANTNVGASFLANPNDINNLASGSVYGRNRTSLIGQENDAKKAQNDYIASINESLASGVKSANENYGANMSNMSNAFAPLNADQKLDPFQYSRSNLPQATLNTTDLSAYKPYVDFNNNPNLFGGSGAAKVQPTNAFTAGTDLTPFLGSNKLSEKGTNYLNKYLMGLAS